MCCIRRARYRGKGVEIVYGVLSRGEWSEPGLQSLPIFASDLEVEGRLRTRIHRTLPTLEVTRNWMQKEETLLNPRATGRNLDEDKRSEVKRSYESTSLVSGLEAYIPPRSKNEGLTAILAKCTGHRQVDLANEIIWYMLKPGQGDIRPNKSKLNINSKQGYSIYKPASPTFLRASFTPWDEQGSPTCQTPSSLLTDRVK